MAEDTGESKHIGGHWISICSSCLAEVLPKPSCRNGDTVNAFYLGHVIALSSLKAGGLMLQWRPMKAAWFDALIFNRHFGGQNCLSVFWLQCLIELAGAGVVDIQT